MSWIRDIADPRNRRWEEFYRNRWQHDKVVRSTHVVNCTGGCSWMVHVKDGIITWELQATDYPRLAGGLPPYEPRGCQRGGSTSWEEVLETRAASAIHTVKRHGPDRVIGFSPIPAMSMLSYAGGSRFLQLLGGVNLSFSDWEM